MPHYGFNARWVQIGNLWIFWVHVKKGVRHPPFLPFEFIQTPQFFFAIQGTAFVVLGIHDTWHGQVALSHFSNIYFFQGIVLLAIFKNPLAWDSHYESHDSIFATRRVTTSPVSGVFTQELEYARFWSLSISLCIGWLPQLTSSYVQPLLDNTRWNSIWCRPHRFAHTSLRWLSVPFFVIASKSFTFDFPLLVEELNASNNHLCPHEWAWTLRWTSMLPTNGRLRLPPTS